MLAPPGDPLPTYNEAIEAVLGARDGTALHTYRVVFDPEPIPEEAVLTVLCNSTAYALRRGRTMSGMWLAARAGLACIALGEFDRAWLYLDGLTDDGQRHPHLDKLAIFEPIRGNGTLEQSRWVRAVIYRLWPHLGVPAVPQLPLAPMTEDRGTSLEDTLEELSRVGATELHALVEAFVDVVKRSGADEHAEDPLVQELQALAMVPGSVPPEVEHLPPWFAEWARAVAAVEHEGAHLTGHDGARPRAAARGGRDRCGSDVGPRCGTTTRDGRAGEQTRW